MIKQLKKSFPSLRVYNGIDDLDPTYKWYITHNHEVIGILKQELSQKDQNILSAFLKRYDMIFPIRTEKESQWHELIFSANSEITSIDYMYRFVHFYIQQEQTDPIIFKEAIEELFAKEIAILWKNEYEGIIVEEQDKIEDPISYNQIIDVLMSDLYVKINFFVGPFQDSIQDVNDYYDSIIQGAQIALKYSKVSVTTYLDIVPYILIDQTNETTRKKIAATILKEFSHDQETLQMIETFINCNLNISVTAKELYMHRNSLQYRLDKFSEKTNIDIRHFHQAMTVYLSLLAHKSS